MNKTEALKRIEMFISRLGSVCEAVSGFFNKSGQKRRVSVDKSTMFFY